MTNRPSDIQTKWEALATQAREDAKAKPEGHERDQLLRRANQLDVSAEIEGWLNSSELRPPGESKTLQSKTTLQK